MVKVGEKDGNDPSMPFELLLDFMDVDRIRGEPLRGVRVLPAEGVLQLRELFLEVMQDKG
jgi:hypothetical protein